MANIVIETFIMGGWVMWPILASFFLALCVILDRAIWWLRFRASVRQKFQQDVREAVGTGDFHTAWEITRCNADEPFLATLGDGMAHANTSMLAAMQLRATRLLERADSRMWILSTMITLAPLLGLFGTVVGIMRSFSFLDGEELAAQQVSGGIAEALIATACGIAIAVLCLLPYNFFRKRLAVLRGSLERWINHSELLAATARERGHRIEDFAIHLAQRQQR